MSHSTHHSSHLLVPEALLLDHRLTPLERNAWLVLRSMAGDDGTVVASYDSLRQYLPCSPGSRKASHETVSKVMLCLRLTTWVVLAGHRRDPVTGFIMASRYAVRGEPISFMQACLEDDDYLMQFERALEHSAANVRQLARCILDEAQAYEQLDHLPEAMQERIGQLWEKAHRRDSDGPGGPPSAGPLLADKPDATGGDDPKSSPPMAETVCTVQNKVLNKVLTYCTETQGRSEEPASARDARTRFQQLPPDQQHYLAERLKGLPPQQRQDVLDEWHVRCTAGYVKNAIAYLYGLIKKAVAGQFRLWAARKPDTAQLIHAAPVAAPPKSRPQGPPAHTASPSAAHRTLAPEARQMGQTYLEQLRGLLDRPKSIHQVIGELERHGVLPRRPDENWKMDYGPPGAV